jgi:hypothetical protein
MHAGQGIAAVNDLRLERGELFQTLLDIRVIAKVLRHPDISRMMPRLGFEQAGVEIAQF